MPDSNYTQEFPEVYSVHPAAEVYPMIIEDELEQLADDIKANGQIDPIIITTDEDGEQVLVDGRNRLAACGIAEVHPVIEWRDFESDDHIKAFILSKNENRRHMTAGQRAMCVIKVIGPEATNKGGRGNKTVGISHTLDRKSLYQARTIEKWNSAETDSVIKGDTKFATALQTAKDNKSAAESRESRLKALPADLQQRVIGEELSLREAEAIDIAKKEDGINERKTQFQVLRDMHMRVEGWGNEDDAVTKKYLDAYVKNKGEYVSRDGEKADVGETLNTILKAVTRMRDLYEQQSQL